ncbi:hypothetical protein ACFOSC_00060 [Streptantibioticus rubrisoli]|uniref:Glycine cleavage system H protein n=1 Tax=Streptantibioticus rubrisoli TaxID=1387313 RepID=A0ABT1PN06_9ACTN|nr:hypothetical protein [Streptantibioticus rubrisoli]MCQ4045660.1 hypothetical protein [Streptantibioticus rubrisoli]
MSSHQPTLSFVYDRSCTSDTTELERRLKACGEYVIAQGCWWRDTGDSALLNDHRPAFDTLLRTMRAAEGCERVCLVYCWERLSGDMAARGLTRRVLLLGGWVETCSGEKRTAGGTEPAGRQGTVVHVVLPKVEASFSSGMPCVVVASAKATADVDMPLDGKIIAVNDALESSPELVDSDPYGGAWLFKFTMTEPNSVYALCDAPEYDIYIGGPTD